MRQITTSRHLSGLLLLQLVWAAQPVLGQDAPASDTTRIEKFHFFPPPAADKQRHSAAGQFLPDIRTDQKPIWTSPVPTNRRQFFTSTAADKQRHFAAGQFLPDIRTDQKPIWTSPVPTNRRQFFTPPADDKQKHLSAGLFPRDIRADQKPTWTSPVPTNRRHFSPLPSTTSKSTPPQANFCAISGQIKRQSGPVLSG